MKKNPIAILDSIQKSHLKAMQKSAVAGSLSKLEEETVLRLNDHLEMIKSQLKNVTSQDEAFAIAKDYFEALKKDVTNSGTKVSKEFSNSFAFLGSVFQSREMSIFVIELTANTYTSKAIGKFGCKEYALYNKSLLISQRKEEIQIEIDSLKLD